MTRGGGKALVFGGPFVTGGGSSNAPILDLATWGTLTRASHGTRMTGAPTDGSTPFMAEESNNIRRFEDRGDGNGPMLLLEGARSVALINSRDPSAAGWDADLAGITTTVNYSASIDGNGSKAYRTLNAGGYWGKRPAAASTAGMAASAWARATTGTTTTRLAVRGGFYGGYNADTKTIGTTYTQFRAAVPTTFDAYVGFWDFYYGGVIASCDYVTDYFSMEIGAFPTSAIITGGSLVDRAADLYDGAIESVPTAMVNGTFQFYIAPVFSSTEGVSHAADQCIFSYAEDDSERIFFVVSGGSIYIRIVSGGATKVTSNALTFSAHQKLAVTIDGAAGSITVAGATTGNGTVTGSSWTRTTGFSMYIGSRQGGTQPLFARLGFDGPTPSYAPSSTKIVLFLLGQSNMLNNGIQDKILREVRGKYPDSVAVAAAYNGTNLYTDWNKSGGTAYASAMTAWANAVAADPTLTSRTPVIVWGQGEADASFATYANAYAANLPALFTNIAADIPFFAGCKKVIHALYPTTGTDPTAPSYTNAATVRAAQAAFAAANPSSVSLIESSDLTTYDGVHYDTTSMIKLARRDGSAIARLVG